MSVHRTRRDLSLKEKCDVLKKYDELGSTNLSQAAAALKLGISQSLLCRLLKNRNDIETSAVNNDSGTRKRKRCGKDDDVESALKKWFVSVRHKDTRLNGPLLQQKAEDLAKKLGKEDFRATNGWFYRWVKRENIAWCKPSGEAGEADAAAAHSWIRDVWPNLIAEYSPDNVFNADETGLYFRALPEHTYACKNEKTKGVKVCKERITVFCCVSMAGKREPLLVIGKSKKPRCFKGVKVLPVTYHNNANAWMTQEIFSEFLQSWDRRLTRKVLLLVDNCTAQRSTYSQKYRTSVPSSQYYLTSPAMRPRHN